MIRNSPCYRTKNSLEENDVVEKADLNEFFMDRLKEAQKMHGPSLLQYITKNVQPETLVYLNNPYPKSDSS